MVGVPGKRTPVFMRYDYYLTAFAGEYILTYAMQMSAADDDCHSAAAWLNTCADFHPFHTACSRLLHNKTLYY